ncbi:MAG: TonB-dependent receptor [Tannerellaceae bacterium]|nr:TonB-dependent receptor [Tannerellaceae bacterium]
MNFHYLQIILAVIFLFPGLAADAQNQTISLPSGALSIQSVFQEIEKQTNLSVDYNHTRLNVSQRVTIPSGRKTLTDLLNEVLKGSGFTFSIEKDHVLIKQVPAEPSSPLSDRKRTLTGRVLDPAGEPVIGANVVESGTRNGAVTDANGQFTLSISANSRLQVSYLGYTTYEIDVQNQSSLEIVLTEDTQALEEVVVVGYGSVKRKDVTTAISSVSTDDLEQRPIISADQALQGKAAGISVIKPNGLPGASMVVRVRGTTSMNGSNDPLYVVDGVPMEDISFLSANDIESMQILKDASSAAIYGSRAANGVIIITTKQGKTGLTKVALNTHIGITNLTNRIEPLNTREYRELMADFGSTTVIPEHLTDVTDWYKEAYQTGVTQNYQASVANAADRWKYFLSGGYTREDGVIKVAFFERYNFRSNIENQVRPWLNIGANVSYSDYASNDIVSGVGSDRGGIVLSVINTPRYATIWDEEHPGQYNNQFYGPPIVHPLESMAQTENARTRNNRLIATGKAAISILPELKLRSSVTLDRRYNHYTNFMDPVKTTWGRFSFGSGTDNRSLSTIMIYDNILTYAKALGKHAIDIMTGTSGTTSTYSETYQSADHFFDSNIRTLNAANKLSQANGTSGREWALMSYLGRVAYNYESKYLLTVNLRVDGSSRLHPEHRWGYFPSASAAWRISSEGFMKDTGWIDDLKIRGGWGQTGNQSGLGDYAYLELYSIQRQDWWEEGKEHALPIVTQSTLRSKELTWETTTQSNIGLDLTVLKNRLTLNLDYYYKKTTDMLMRVSLPTGASVANSIRRNEGEMTNQGFEFTLNSRNLTGAFSWETDINFSTNRNKLTKLSLSQVYYDALILNIAEYAVRNAPGRPLSGFYGYISDGVDPQTGELIYRDVNEDGIISPTDRTYIGDPNPDFTFGLSNRLSWKGFNLNILLQGSVGNDIYNASRVETEGMYNTKNQSKKVLERWKKPGDITEVPKARFVIKSSSYFVEDGSYLRVKDVSLSYNLAKGIVKKWGITRLQPYVTATNLFTFTRYSGMDPEVNQWGNSGAIQGMDQGTYPQTKSFIFGLNIEF